MKALFVTIAALASAAPAAAGVLTVGNSHARNCYLAAETRAATFDALGECDMAIVEPLETADRIATFVNRGILRMVMNDDADALSDFDRALAMHPGQAEAWLNRGILQLKLGNSREALLSADRALEFDTRKPAVAYYIRAVAHEDRGDVKAAFLDLQKAAELAPQWPAPRRELERYRIVR